MVGDGGQLSLEQLVIFAQVALGVSQVAFGGLNWALDGAAAPVAAVERLEPAMAPLGRPAARHRSAAESAAVAGAAGRRASAIRAATDPSSPVSTSPCRPATSLAIVGQNGAGKTTLAKLLCRLYDPDSGPDRGRTASTCATST